MRPPPLFLLLLAWLAASPAARAHRLSDATLQVRIEGTELHGRLEVALRDLAAVVPLDANADDRVTWGELRTATPAIEAYTRGHLAVWTDGQPAALRFGEMQVSSLGGEPCASVAVRAAVGTPRELTLEYHLLFAVDSQHRGLLRLERGGASEVAIFSPERSRFTCPPDGTSPAPPSWGHFVREGIHHIAIGTDHLLFLLALLLPAVVRREAGGFRAAERLGPVAATVLKTVTAFTVAHSLTLALATLGLVRLPSRAVESAIAVSVAVAALHNLRPGSRDRGWWMAAAFGLVHGFGFAGVLGDLALPRAAFARGLLGFNLGVELGQLVAVSAFLPVAFALRHGWFYRRVVLQAGSAGIAALATVWVAERALGCSLLP